MIMARPKPPLFDKQKTVAENRRAKFDYFIEDVFEAGIALSGTEVKALRGGQGSIVGTMLGALLLVVLANAIGLANVNAYWQRVIIGCVVLLAVLVDLFRRRD